MRVTAPPVAASYSSQLNMSHYQLTGPRCGSLCQADEHPRKLARLSPGVSDGDYATIWSLLVAQLEHRYACGQRPGDQLRDECDADARRDAGEFADPVGDHDLGRRAEVIKAVRAQQRVLVGVRAGDERVADDQLRVLDKASAPSLGFPHDLLRRENVTIGTYGDQWRLVDDRRTRHRRSTYL